MFHLKVLQNRPKILAHTIDVFPHDLSLIKTTYPCHIGWCKYIKERCLATRKDTVYTM